MLTMFTMFTVLTMLTMLTVRGRTVNTDSQHRKRLQRLLFPEVEDE